MYEVIKKAGLFHGEIVIYPDGSLAHSCKLKQQTKLQQKAWLVLNCVDDPLNKIDNRLCHRNPSLGKRIYVYSQCRLSRDNIRMSQYQIVRDKNNADFLLVPWRRWDNEYKERLMYNIAAVTTNQDVYLFNVKRTRNNTVKPEVTEEELGKIKAKVVELTEDSQSRIFFSNDELTSACAYYMPSIDAYEDILLDERYEHSYMYDVDLDTCYINEITPENLEIWSLCEYKDVLEKAIITSNWKEYPFTIGRFIYEIKESLKYSSNANMKLVLEGINYEFIDDATLVINPKDFDMYQRWKMMRLHLDERGGYIGKKDFSELGYEERRLIRTKIAVKPMSIDEPTTFGDIISHIENA